MIQHVRELVDKVSTINYNMDLDSSAIQADKLINNEIEQQLHDVNNYLCGVQREVHSFCGLHLGSLTGVLSPLAEGLLVPAFSFGVLVY